MKRSRAYYRVPFGLAALWVAVAMPFWMCWKAIQGTIAFLRWTLVGGARDIQRISRAYQARHPQHVPAAQAALNSSGQHLIAALRHAAVAIRNW